jgi:CRP-like cAMP-binding protein
VGDTRQQLAKQITTAVGDATTAVLHAERYIEDLKHVERAMPKAEGRTVAEATRSLRTVRFAAGQRVVRQGEIGDEFYIVVRGALDIVHEDDAGKLHVVRTIGEGDSFGEIALLADVPRTATVVAKAESEVLVMDRGTFRRIVDSNPEAVQDIYARAAERLKELRATRRGRELLHEGDDLVEVEGLLHVGGDAAGAHVLRVLGCDRGLEHDRYLAQARVLAHAVKHLETGHARQPDVHQDQIRVHGAERVEGVGALADPDGDVAGLIVDGAGEQLGDRLVVLHDEHDEEGTGFPHTSAM